MCTRPASTGERLEVSTLVATYDWDSVALTSASNFAKLKAVFRDDMIPFVLSAFGVPLPWQDRTDSDSEVFTQEVRLQSKGDRRSSGSSARSISISTSM